MKSEGLADPEACFAVSGRANPVCHMKVGPHSREMALPFTMGVGKQTLMSWKEKKHDPKLVLPIKTHSQIFRVKTERSEKQKSGDCHLLPL